MIMARGASKASEKQRKKQTNKINGIRYENCTKCDYLQSGSVPDCVRPTVVALEHATAVDAGKTVVAAAAVAVAVAAETVAAVTHAAFAGPAVVAVAAAAFEGSVAAAAALAVAAVVAVEAAPVAAAFAAAETTAETPRVCRRTERLSRPQKQQM